MNAVHDLSVALPYASYNLSPVSAPDGNSRVLAPTEDELLLSSAETASQNVHALLVPTLVFADEFRFFRIQVSKVVEL